MNENLEKFDQAAEIAYRRQRITHWDKVASQLDNWTGWGRYYHRRLAEIYQFLVAPQQRIQELRIDKRMQLCFKRTLSINTCLNEGMYNLIKEIPLYLIPVSYYIVYPHEF